MLPKRLNRVQMLGSGSLKADEVRPGMFSIQGGFRVRDLDEYFNPTGLYVPSDWTDEAPSAPADGPARRSEAAPGDREGV